MESIQYKNEPSKRADSQYNQLYYTDEAPNIN